MRYELQCEPELDDFSIVGNFTNYKIANAYGQAIIHGGRGIWAVCLNYQGSGHCR